jgi:hypothetical protein
VTPQVAQQWFGVAKDAVGTANEEAMGGVSLVVTDGAALEKSKTSKTSKKSKKSKSSKESRQSRQSRGGAGRRKGRADAEDDGEEGAEKETEGEGEGEGEQHALLAMATDDFEPDSIRRFLTTEITARAPRKSARAQESCNQADAASEYE